MLQVESDLKQLIGLTKENLLEEKKKELLAQIACFDDEDDDDPMQVSAPLEGETPSTSREDETPMPVDFSCLEGVKCQAPHSTGWVLILLYIFLRPYQKVMLGEDSNLVGRVTNKERPSI